jgi:hypothetical protein
MDKPLKLYVADVSLRVYVVSRSEDAARREAIRAIADEALEAAIQDMDFNEAGECASFADRRVSPYVVPGTDVDEIRPFTVQGVLNYLASNETREPNP